MKQSPLVRLACTVVLAWALLCMNSRAASPAIVAPSVAALLTQAKQVQGSDPGRFQSLLAQLHQRDAQLAPAQRWQLRELDAWQLSFEGDYGKADPIFRDIIDHSGDRSLSIRAISWLIEDSFRDHRYVEAYAMANTLMKDLPEVSDPEARMAGLSQIIQMLNQQVVGQHDLALVYAQQMKASFPSAAGQCNASVYETQSLLYANKLPSDSPVFESAIDLCAAAKLPLLADSLRLDQVSHMVDEGRAGRAITYLNQMAPEIRRTGYPGYIASLSVTLAQAYLSLGNIGKARQFALASLATPGVSGSQWIVQAAYEVLYKAEKKDGHAAAALTYYEKYVAQEKAAMDDAKARALAYQMVKQQVEAKKLKLEALTKQNRILQLRQALASQAQKTSRLYIALLLVVVAFITLTMLWLRRSQLRFRRMARHDGLTGAFNREHFFEQAGRTLRRLHKDRVGACLAVLDMDYFKQINDTHGHAVGDEVLRRTAAIVREELRASDVFGRLGGEEFGLLMPACSREQGVEIANRIRRALAAVPMVLESQLTITVTASLGLAYCDDSDCSLRQLLIRADAALYCAKDGGRNQVAVDTDVESPASDRADDQVAISA